LISSYFSSKHIFKTISAIRACHRFLRDLLSGVYPRSRIPDVTLLVASLSMHPSETARQSFAYLPSVARRVPQRAAKFYYRTPARDGDRKGPFAKWANGKNKEGIRAMKTACGLPNVHEGGQAAIAVNVVKRCIVC